MSRRAVPRRRDERGAVAVVVAISLTAILVAAGLVLDFGVVRIDRQVDKSSADSATLAGLHALSDGAGKAHPYNGVCTAIRYLRSNSARFSGISSGTGTWTDGNGAAVGNGCSDTTLQNTICSASDLATWARFVWSTTYQGTILRVTIQSGYSLSGSTLAEDQLAASSADASDSAGGCYQLAVWVTQARSPSFGSLATSSDLVTTVRSVGRVKSSPGGYAPAMILLKQAGCSILTAGSSAGGSRVLVKGAVSVDGVNTQPGTIHSDTDGTGCGSNENIYTGQADNGIVAYAAPLLSNPAAADPLKPGEISSYAAKLGVTGTTLRDSTSHVCGSSGVYPSGTCPGPAGVSGRDRVFRKPVDERYLAGVQAVRDAANVVFNQLATPPASLTGYTTIPGGCAPTQAQITALNLTAASKVYSPCTANNGFTAAVTINAGTVVFAGKVGPSGTLSLPNATAVYVNGSSGDAITLSNGNTFSVHTQPSGNVDTTTGLCADGATNLADRAVLVVKDGDVKQTGGTLQLCYTSVVMMGGQTNACMPATPSTTAPNPTTPCGGSAGTGQFTQTGGNVDWTAPNRYSVMNLADGAPDPGKAGEWSSAAGPEDLGLWSESGGTSSNPKFQMTGGGTVHLVGVLMTPNAQPFNLSGQFVQNLVNAQYVASSISLSSNNTLITMSVDPNAAVTLPRLTLVGLVR